MEEARGCWAIANGQHYRRDLTMREDRCLVSPTQADITLPVFRFSSSIRDPP